MLVVSEKESIHAERAKSSRSLEDFLRSFLPGDGFFSDAPKQGALDSSRHEFVQHLDMYRVLGNPNNEESFTCYAPHNSELVKEVIFNLIKTYYESRGCSVMELGTDKQGFIVEDPNQPNNYYDVFFTKFKSPQMTEGVPVSYFNCSVGKHEVSWGLK